MMSKRAQQLLVQSLVLAVFTVLAALFLLLHLQGGRLMSVQSGSMEPAISTGDLLVVDTRARHFEVGDVVTFKSLDDPNILVTHRVTEPVDDAGMLVTKGDANSRADQAIHAKRVVGRVTQVAPFAGSAVDVIRQPLGLLVAIYIPALIIIVSEIRQLTRYYKSRAPYRHPAAARELSLIKSPNPRLQQLGNLVMAGVMMSSVISLPALANMFSLSTLSGTTITTLPGETDPEPDGLLIRHVALRCWRHNTDQENFRPSFVLYNPTDEKIKLKGWTLESSQGVLAQFGRRHRVKPQRNLWITPHLRQGLNYAGDAIILKDANGTTVDALSWGDNTTYFDPSLPEPMDGTRFTRQPKDVDTDTADDFRVRNFRRCRHFHFWFHPWEFAQYEDRPVFIYPLTSSDD